MKSQTNFEAWAKLLITRKVPGDLSHLIDSEVIHSGADILKHGGAFEVHLEQASHPAKTERRWEPPHGRIFVTPIATRIVVRAYAN